MLSFYKKLSLIVILSSVICTGSIQAAAARAAAPSDSRSFSASAAEGVIIPKPKFIHAAYSLDPVSNFFDFPEPVEKIFPDGKVRKEHALLEVGYHQLDSTTKIAKDIVEDLIRLDDQKFLKNLQAMLMNYILNCEQLQNQMLWTPNLTPPDLLRGMSEAMLYFNVAVKIMVEAINAKPYLFFNKGLNFFEIINPLLEKNKERINRYFKNIKAMKSRISAQLGPKEDIRPKIPRDELLEIDKIINQQAKDIEIVIAAFIYDNVRYINFIGLYISDAEEYQLRPSTDAQKMIPITPLTAAEQAEVVTKYKIECERLAEIEAQRIVRIDLTESESEKVPGLKDLSLE